MGFLLLGKKKKTKLTQLWLSWRVRVWAFGEGTRKGLILEKPVSSDSGFEGNPFLRISNFFSIKTRQSKSGVGSFLLKLSKYFFFTVYLVVSVSGVWRDAFVFSDQVSFT